MKTICNFVGAHSTGKTTVMEALLDKIPGSAIPPSVSRNNIQSHDLNLNGEIGDVQQSYISLFNWHRALFNNNKVTFSTDVIIRSLAYTMGSKNTSLELAQLHQNFLKHVMEDPRFNIVTFYIPIEFDIVRDNVRDTDIEYQHQIDTYIVNILDEFEINPLVVLSGSVEDRVEKAERIIMELI